MRVYMRVRSAPPQVPFVMPRAGSTSHASLLHARLPVDASTERSTPAMVSGPNRARYFSKPVAPGLVSAASVLLQQTRAMPLTDSAHVDLPTERLDSPPPRTRTVAVQTAYRESEAQTDPYTPDYVVPGGGLQPELLTLATFCWGHGLPAGQAEIEMIERARQKRAWEATLPPLDDASQFGVRQRMMEEMEMREWREREAEIERLQLARLELLRCMIEKADEENDVLNEERVAEVWRQAAAAKDAKLAQIELNRIKSLRKVARKRAQAEGLLERRDIIDDYANYASKVYAPVTREGAASHAAKIAVVSRQLPDTRSLEALRSLEAFIPKSAFTAVIDLPVRDAKPKTPKARAARRVNEQLAIVDATLKKRKDASVRPRTPLTCAHRVEQPPERPPTPHLPRPDVLEEERDVAVMLLQSLLRGRAMQNFMFAGKTRRLPLIAELRTAHAVSDAERAELRRMRDETLAARAAAAATREAQQAADAAVESLQGELIGAALAHLSRELVRLREERRVAAIVKLAERERRRREASESAARAAEEQRRAEEDARFRQIMGAHRGTIDSYLDEVLGHAVAGTARRQAVEEARVKASQLSTIVDALEAERDAPATIVSDLVASYLFPEVERRSLKAKIAHEQRRYLLGARLAVGEAMQPHLAASAAAREAKAAAKVTATAPAVSSPLARPARK